MGECEGADVAGMQSYGGIGGEVRTFLGECGGVAGKDGDAGIEAEEVIDVAEAFDEPAAEEAGASSEKDALRAQFIPESLCGFGNQIKICSQRVHKLRSLGADQFLASMPRL